MSEEKIEIQKGSGNIFKDLEIPNSEEYLEKVHLAFIIEDRITESGLRVEEAARILNLSATKLSNLLDGLLDDFSIGDLTTLITKLKSVTADTVPGYIDRFLQWFQEVFRSLVPNPLVVGTTGFGVLLLIIGGLYFTSRYFAKGLSDTDSVARQNGITPVVQVEPEFVKGVSKNVKVSRFGFGAFPDIPTDFPDQDIWNVVEGRSIHDPEGAKILELLARVRIKLWGQGKRTKGVIMEPSSGLIYSDSNIEISFLLSPDLPRYDTYFDEDFIQSGGIVVKFLEGGIDPYEFLNLPR